MAERVPSTDLPIHLWESIRKGAPTEHAIRADERRRLAALIPDTDGLADVLAAITDPKAKRAASNLVHLLRDCLEPGQATAAA